MARLCLRHWACLACKVQVHMVLERETWCRDDRMAPACREASQKPPETMREWTPLVLRPTVEEVLSTSFEAYITKHEAKLLKAGGICKIVLPAGLTPRRAGYDVEGLDITLQRSIRQNAVGNRGLWRMVYVEQKPVTLAEFQTMAMDKANAPPCDADGKPLDDADLERKFWKNVAIRAPLYGADVEGSLFDERAKGWNLRNLNTLLSKVLSEAGFKLPGVNTPYLYFGHWRSVFGWHTEDLDLYSVNYIHFGASKQWYVIPPEFRARFESVTRSLVPEMHRHCPEFLRHKELLVSPQLLDQYQIPYVKVVQHAREFVVVYPGVYHAGFNQGFNCAESVNFATKSWIPIGARAGTCRCHPDAVHIDMRLFRHLVPAKDLPESLLMDSSDEEEEEEEEDSDATNSDTQVETISTDSDDSTTDTLHMHHHHHHHSHQGNGNNHGRKRMASAADAGRSGPASKRARVASHQAAVLAAAASKAQDAKQQAGRSRAPVEVAEDPYARPRLKPPLGQAAPRKVREGAVTRGSAPARMNVRERVMLRMAEQRTTRGVAPAAQQAAGTRKPAVQQPASGSAPTARPQRVMRPPAKHLPTGSQPVVARRQEASLPDTTKPEQEEEVSVDDGSALTPQPAAAMVPAKLNTHAPSPLPPSAASTRPRRANAGINRWRQDGLQDIEPADPAPAVTPLSKDRPMTRRAAALAAATAPTTTGQQAEAEDTGSGMMGQVKAVATRLMNRVHAAFGQQEAAPATNTTTATARPTRTRGTAR